MGVGGSSREGVGLVTTTKQVSKFSPCFNLSLYPLMLMFCAVGLREALFMMRSVCLFCMIMMYRL